MVYINELIKEYRCYSHQVKEPYKWILMMLILPLFIFSKQEVSREVNKDMYTIF